jgi:hypothetical protein
VFILRQKGLNNKDWSANREEPCAQPLHKATTRAPPEPPHQQRGEPSSRIGWMMKMEVFLSSSFVMSV